MFSTSDTNASVAQEESTVTNDPQKNSVDQSSMPVDKYISVDVPYCTWNTNVNLRPPLASDKPLPPEDRFLDYYYNILQYILYETGFPETIDETKVQINCDGGWRSSEFEVDTGVTIAVLSNPFDVIGFLLEGGRQCPGDLLLVLSMTWVEKRKPTASDVGDDEGLYRLYVHKAIAFMQNGRSALRVYSPPRPVTYCVNFFTLACTDFRNDGYGLEVDLDCTMVGSKLTAQVDDKLWTRIKASEVGVRVPETLAFSFRSRFTYDCTLSSATINVIQLKSKDESENSEMIQAAVDAFVNSPIMLRHQKVVVKPSGLMWCGSLGVSFHDRGDMSSIVAACLSLLGNIQEGDAILVETFYPTIKPRHVGSDLPAPTKKWCPTAGHGTALHTENLSWAANESSACRFRATVCRDSSGKAHMSKMVCSIACQNLPVYGDNSLGQSLDSTLIAFGVVDRPQRIQIYDDLRSAAENTMAAIIHHESTMSAEERGSPGAQTDLVGIDFILSDQNNNNDDGSSTFIPVVVEVNSMNCLNNCDKFEYMYRETSGEALQTFFEHAITVSQHRQLKGRQLVMFGGDIDFVARAAEDYKIHITHFTETPADVSQMSKIHSLMFYTQLPYTVDCDNDEIVLHKLVSVFRSGFPDIVVNGCLSLKPNLVALASSFGTRLCLQDATLTAQKAARASLNVADTQRFISSRTAAIPHWPPTYLYSLLHDFSGALPAPISLLALLNCDGRKPNAVQSFPDIEELIPYVKQIHRVSVVIMRRKLLGGFVSDYVRGRKGKVPENSCSIANNCEKNESGCSFVEGLSKVDGFRPLNNDLHAKANPLFNRLHESHQLSCEGSVPAKLLDGHLVGCHTPASDKFRWPTVLPDDKRDQLIIAAYQCINELDLVSGLFTVDMTFNSVSPKLLRIVPCLDATSSEVNLLRLTIGVDLFMYAALIACDLKPVLPVDSSFQNHLRARRPNFGHRAFDHKRLAELDINI